MALSIGPLRADKPDFVGAVEGVDIAAGVSAEDAANIEAAMDHYAVLIFRDQAIADAQQYAFSEHFGPMEQATGDIHKAAERRLSLKVNDISNLDENNRVVARDSERRLAALSNRMWHTDSSFKETPAKYSLLSARSIPGQGGETQFADLRAAYDALPEKRKQAIEGMVAQHWLTHSRAKLSLDNFTESERAAEPPVRQLLVRTHPGSGRKTLYLASHTDHIIGMPVPEGRMLLHDLIEHATQPQFVHTHKWRVDDLVIWDDRCTMHRAREYDITQVRDMHRTTVEDAGPTVEQAQVA